MNLRSLSVLAWKHTRNTIAEEVYLQTRRDVTKPVMFYGLVNERCNLKCRYCEYWRLKHYAAELSTREWENCLTSIKDFVGKFSISFSGGEPFIKRGFIDLVDWCAHNGIAAGVTTNGSALTQRNVEKLVAATPFNVNVSVDAPSAEIHDFLRGSPGSFEKLSNGIQRLIKERDKRGAKFPIIIKPTINARNFRHLPELVEWTQAMGASAINMQPMDRWTQETYDELWIEESDIPELEDIVERLIHMKQNGAPILTPNSVMALLPNHFRNEKAPPELSPCRIGLQEFFIRADGSVQLCMFYPTVGNVKEQSARDIWYGHKAKEIREQTVACERLCLLACTSQKTLSSKMKMGLRLLNS